MFTRFSPVPVRVLLVGPQQLWRESLALLLAATDALQIVGQLDSDITRLFFIKASPPDVILVDVDLPAGPSLPLATALRQHFPTLPLVVLTSCTQRDLLRQLLALNIQACLSKDIAGQELVDALLSVVKPGGATIIAASLTKLLWADNVGENDFARRQATLTPSEQTVFSLILAGKKNQEIAQLLHINPQSVRNLNKFIYEKFGVNSRVDLFLLAHRAKSG